MRIDEISGIRQALASAAQAQLDLWEQDEDGCDEELGNGGACQEIASALAAVLALNGVEETAEIFTELDGGHVFVIALFEDGVASVDIPASVYETGAGYVWRKRPGVQLSEDSVVYSRIEGPISVADFRWRYMDEAPPSMENSVLSP